jgi:hypothetical protein
MHLVPLLDRIVASAGVAFHMESTVKEAVARTLLPALLEAESINERPLDVLCCQAWAGVFEIGGVSSALGFGPRLIP